uniref:type IV secretory system conjugative DNA transfer family protein n=1 Tax=uncultured Dysosmobacter sp. TaxID=2591384 RepID=UPI00260ABE1C
ARKIGMIRQNEKADRMDASIKGILAQHLDVVAYPGMRRMFRMKQQVDMGSFLREKTALFISISDSDRSQDSLVNLFYTQALQYLMNAADKQSDSRLPIPVRFILDDFSTNTLIPDFDKIISVIRSREIYVSLVVQSLSQLEGLYGHARAQTIVNNCDHCLYLGGADIETAEYFARKLNRLTSTVLDLPLDSMFLFTRGEKPRKVQKYELDQDNTYHRLMDSHTREMEPADVEVGRQI